MSALGQKQTCAAQKVMSATPNSGHSREFRSHQKKNPGTICRGFYARRYSRTTSVHPDPRIYGRLGQCR